LRLLDKPFTFTEKLSIMKKLALVASVLLLVALVFSSCKSVQDCPAYGQADVETEEVRARFFN